MTFSNAVRSAPCLLLAVLTACGGAPPGTRRPGASVSSVTLNDGALAPGANQNGLTGGTGSEQLFHVDVPAGAANLTFTLTGPASSTIDADLYVRFGAAPTLSVFDCRSFTVGSNESCSFTAPQVGSYQVMVYGFTAYSGVTLAVKWEITGGSTTAVTFQVDSAATIWGQSVFVVGDALELGAWAPSHAVQLAPTSYPTWTGTVAMAAGAHVNFKFILLDGAGAPVWEGGNNRTFDVPSQTTGQYTGTWQP